MDIFDSIAHERKRYYERAGVHLITPRSKHAFFPNWHTHQVTCLDPFQSKRDFQTDFQSIAIKPATCYFLSWFHKGQTLYELSLAIAHLISLSPKKAFKHANHAIDSFMASVIYNYLTLIEALVQTVSFLMRSLISIGVGIFNLGTGKEHRHNTKEQEEPSVVSAAFAL